MAFACYTLSRKNKMFGGPVQNKLFIHTCYIVPFSLSALTLYVEAIPWS